MATAPSLPARQNGAMLATGLALALACLMTLAWALRDWANLSVLHLPDTDDVMRLQQIRDWLAGQDFTDLTQHRLGAAPGLAMHWSRIADLVPGGIITALSPRLGQHHAELIAVIAWPGMLLAAALMLTASIARRADPHGEPLTAIIIAAIAYPATTIFAPGRIDHHGLQIVLLLVAVRALIARPGLTSGLAIGVATALSLMIGLETAPMLLAMALIVWIGWLTPAPDTDRRLLGYGLSLGFALAFGALAFGGSGWRYPACDGFTERAWMLAQGGSFAAIGLAFVGRAMPAKPPRVALSAVAGAALVALLFPTISACANPYGSVDPMLAQLWLDNVGEAQGLFAASPATAIGYAGVMVAGLAVTFWLWLRSGGTAWAILGTLQVTALAVTVLQLRGAYAGAILAAPALAMLVAEARQRGGGWLAGAWLASAGMLYPIAANALALIPDGAPHQSGAATSAACASPETLARLAALPPGTVMAPIDVGPYAIAATHHRLIAAPYHRNNAGNAAMYRFFAGSPDAARQIADQWRIDYVLVCHPMLGELGPAPQADPRRLIGLLNAGHPPVWLRAVTSTADSTQIFDVERRLPREAKPL